MFEIRWCERLRDLDSTRFRILFGGAVYNITCVDDVQFRHEKLKWKSPSERHLPLGGEDIAEHPGQLVHVGVLILFNGAIYNITSVDDVQFRHKRLKLTAQRERR